MRTSTVYPVKHEPPQPHVATPPQYRPPSSTAPSAGLGSSASLGLSWPRATVAPPIGHGQLSPFEDELGRSAEGALDEGQKPRGWWAVIGGRGRGGFVVQVRLSTVIEF